jgi:transitional endoplasmic reticulum ATPase
MKMGGRKHMRLPGINEEISSKLIHIDMDKNERFILRKSAQFLQRHFKLYPSFSKEAVKMLCWTLGEKIRRIDQFLITHLSEKNKVAFKESLSENGHDFEDHVDLVFGKLKKLTKANLRKLQQLVLSFLEINAARAGYRGKADFEKNVAVLKSMFGLTDHEEEFMIFLFVISTSEAAQEFFVGHLECNKIMGRKYLANVLGLSKTELNRILTGTLRKIEFFEMDGYDLRVEDKFLGLFQNPSDRNFSDEFYSRISQGSRLPMEYFLIKPDHRNYIISLLKKKQETPTHVLLYGPPGTGKTSFARSLADYLGIPSYDVVKDETNTTRSRRAAILACLNMTNSGPGSLVIVDEADNLLNTQFSFFMRGETQDKGWLNELLEKPGTRMIWITNSIWGIEESVLRRFAFSLHFRSFNRRQRMQLWENIINANRVERFFGSKDIERYARKYSVNAGVIDLAVKKSVETKPRSKARFHKALKLALEAHRTLANYGEKPVDKNRVEQNYSLEGLNVSGDIKSMMTRLEKFDAFLRNPENRQIINMNLLFYGPPGTGKSELARYIADRLDREIICKRVSDLQSKYVGEGEKNIKYAFQEAEAEEAILVIDEADSLLFSRERAVRSWEISFTNEFLTQMERFRGILICTTNRMKDLDDASIRRFNHKLKFDYLLPDGNVVFYEKLLVNLIGPSLDEKSRAELKNILNLTPGDFKTVRDRFAFYTPEELSHKMLLEALKDESRIKNDHGKNVKIGY